METIVVFGVLVGLDNFQVVAGLSLMRVRVPKLWLLVAAFGVCEAVMPLIGLVAGHLINQSLSSAAAGVGPLILIVCGLLIILLALSKKDANAVANSGWFSIALPFSLSIDNLFAGVGLGAMGYSVLTSALVIGAICISMCWLGVVVGRSVGRLIPDKVEVLSGVYLVIIAVIKLLGDSGGQ